MSATTSTLKPSAGGGAREDRPAFVRLGASIAPWLLAALAFGAAPFLFSGGAALTMMSLIGIMIVFSLSYNMLLGETGMLSFGHAVYYGFGALFSAHAMNAVAAGGLPIPLPAIPIVGGLAGLAFGIAFGWVSTRRGGTAFAMISLGLAELVSSSANIFRSLFGGEEGISTDRSKLIRIFDLGFGPQIQVYYLVAAWCLLCMLAMYAIRRTPLGRMCNAVRENAERVQFVGYDPQVVRFVAFCVSSFFAGIAGALAAINFEIVNGTYFGAAQSGIVLLAAFIGGTGHFVGPVIGAVVVTWLQVMLSDVTPIWQLYFGLLFIVIVLFAPGGIASLAALHGPLLRGGRFGRVAPAYLLTIAAGLLTVAGAVAAIEMTNRLLAHAQEGSAMRLLFVRVDAASATSWLGAAALVVVGALLFRRSFPRVAAAWQAGSVEGRR